MRPSCPCCPNWLQCALGIGESQMSLRNRIISISIFVGCFSPIPAFADECYSIADKMVSIAKEFGSSVLTTTLRKNKEASYIFFIGQNQTAVENNVPWLLAGRASNNDPSRYCTIGKETGLSFWRVCKKLNLRRDLAFQDRDTRDAPTRVTLLDR